MSQISLTFHGYWSDRNRGSIPAQSGVYCVYRGIDNGQTVTLNQLLYVGESENANARLASHEREQDWKRQLNFGETLIFAFAPITVGRERAEAAIIFRHRPPLNTSCKDAFSYDSTEITSVGQNAFLDPRFAVHRNAVSSFSASSYLTGR